MVGKSTCGSGATGRNGNAVIPTKASATVNVPFFQRSPQGAQIIDLDPDMKIDRTHLDGRCLLEIPRQLKRRMGVPLAVAHMADLDVAGLVRSAAHHLHAEVLRVELDRAVKVADGKHRMVDAETIAHRLLPVPTLRCDEPSPIGYRKSISWGHLREAPQRCASTYEISFLHRGSGDLPGTAP